MFVVENDPGAVRLLQVILPVDGSFSQFRRAGSLARALERLAPQAWEVILLDLGLPDSRGLEALEKYLPGYTENGLGIRTIDSETSFLRKPFSAAGLGRKVRDVLDS